LFCAASVYDFNIDSRTEGGYPYLTYASGDIFDTTVSLGTSDMGMADEKNPEYRSVGEVGALLECDVWPSRPRHPQSIAATSHQLSGPCEDE
jgi:hypothetical protein